MSVSFRLRVFCVAVGFTLAAPGLAQASTPVITAPTPGATINSEDVTVAFHDPANAAADFECGFDDHGWEECETGDVYGPFENGEYTLFVAADGDREHAAQVTFTVAGPTAPGADTTPPETTISEGPTEGALTRFLTHKFVFTSDESWVSYTCAKDGATTFTPCVSGQLFPFSGEGAHSLAVRALDGNGNLDATPAVRTFVVDSIGPEASLTGRQLDDRGAAYEWSFTANEPGVRFECSLDTAAFAPCTAPMTTNTAPGVHKFDVHAIDAAGNSSARQRMNWTTAPLPKVLAPAVTLGAPPTSIKTFRSKGLSVPVTTNGPSEVTGALIVSAATAKKLKLGKKQTRIGSGSGQINGTGKLVIKLTAKAKAKLRKVRRFAATVSISATNAGGTTTETRLVRLK